MRTECGWRGWREREEDEGHASAVLVLFEKTLVGVRRGPLQHNVRQDALHLRVDRAVLVEEPELGHVLCREGDFAVVGRREAPTYVVERAGRPFSRARQRVLDVDVGR